MDRNYIVELIKSNRLQEAIAALENATKGSHLHNDLISISAAYADYTRLNRNATEDFQTLDIQRAKITQRLLSALDEISPEDLKEAVIYTPKKSVASSITDNKPLMYGIIGAFALLLILLLIPAGDNNGANTGNEQIGSGPVPPSNFVDCSNVFLVEYINDKNRKTGFEYNGSEWIEDGKFHFTEVKRENGAIYIHDDARQLNVELNLNSKRIMYRNDTESDYNFLANIAHFE